MIILYNPKATKPRSRRFPLSVLALAAVLEGREEYSIVDGNVDERATETIATLLREHPVELLAATVMPGPQMVSALETCREIPRAFSARPYRLGRLLSLDLSGRSA